MDNQYIDDATLSQFRSEGWFQELGELEGDIPSAVLVKVIVLAQVGTYVVNTS